MKDIKTLMIGFLLATCMFLIMGFFGLNSQIGRYVIVEDRTSRLLDTTTGEIQEYKLGTYGLEGRKWTNLNPPLPK